MTCITYPLRKRKIASEMVFFALKSLFNASRIQKPQDLRLFDAVLAIFQLSDA